MLPMRFSTIFRNRWWAVLWAAGMIWFAVDMAGTPEAPADGNGLAASDAAGDPIGNSDVENLEAIVANM